jgi:hypothetical protein
MYKARGSSPEPPWLDPGQIMLAMRPSFVDSWLYINFTQTHMITPFSYGGKIMTRDVALVACLHHLCINLTHHA